jgi:hypothetical protein
MYRAVHWTRIRTKSSFGDRSPARTCRPTHTDRCARLHRTILLPVCPFHSIRRSQRRGVAAQSRSLPACQLLGPTASCPGTSAVSRRPAASEFASESHLGSPGGVPGPAGHPARKTRASSRGSELRCIVSHEASQSRRPACETPSDRSLRGESRSSDGKATTLRSIPRRSCSILGLSCVWDVHASLGLCRSLLPVAFDLEKSSDMVGARLMT